MMAPSGTFCTVMPMASAITPAAVTLPPPESSPASATPTAMPSGRLWMVTASSIIKCPGRFFAARSSGVRSRSSHKRPPTPAKKPITAGPHARCPARSAISMAGISSDHTIAASITPEAKPSIPFFSPERSSFFMQNTAAAPAAVPKKGSRTPTAVSQIKVKAPLSSEIARRSAG